MFTQRKDRSRSAILTIGAAATLAVLLGVSGCKHTAPDDASLTQSVRSKLSSDTALASEPIQASAQQGVATLDGTVSNDAARSLAANDVAQVPGIRTVVNNLTVTVPPAAPTAAPVTALAPPAPRVNQPKAPRPVSIRKPTQKPSAEVQQPPQQAQEIQPAPIERARPAEPAAPPPPPPTVRSVTLPAGSTIAVRLNQTLDSASTQSGERFSGSLASDILVDGLVVLPQGTPVSGRVDTVQEAAHFKGSSLLEIELTSIDRRGDRLPITTDTFSKAGDGRGKNSAEKIGGGAAVGAILGGIFGGGKGAAIGAAAGGGAGAGVQGITRGQQVQIPAESLVRFHLGNAVTVRVSSPDHSAAAEGDLQRH